MTEADNKFGLIGYPVGHSLSPVLFRSGFNGSYQYDLIENNDFELAYEAFIKGYKAVNITSPFKEKACLKADYSSQECLILGACNILKKTSEGIFATNTDYLGVLNCLVNEPSIKKVKPLTVIVGCGGAGKAAAYAACELGNEVIILNRDIQKARDFAEKLNEISPTNRVWAKPLHCFKEYFRKAGVIIYTIPVNIPELDTMSRWDVKGGLFCSKEKILLEANYRNPSFTSDVQEKLGRINPKLRFISGKEWLLYQAIEAFEIFTDSRPNIKEMRKVL